MLMENFPSHWWRGREGIYSWASSPSFSSSSSSSVQESSGSTFVLFLGSVCETMHCLWAGLALLEMDLPYESFFETLHSALFAGWSCPSWR